VCAKTDRLTFADPSSQLEEEEKEKKEMDAAKAHFDKLPSK
jgi:hypothetical protein